MRRFRIPNYNQMQNQRRSNGSPGFESEFKQFLGGFMPIAQAKVPSGFYHKGAWYKVNPCVYQVYSKPFSATQRANEPYVQGRAAKGTQTPPWARGQGQQTTMFGPSRPYVRPWQGRKWQPERKLCNHLSRKQRRRNYQRYNYWQKASTQNGEEQRQQQQQQQKEQQQQEKQQQDQQQQDQQPSSQQTAVAAGSSTAGGDHVPAVAMQHPRPPQAAHAPEAAGMAQVQQQFAEGAFNYTHPFLTHAYPPHAYPPHAYPPNAYPPQSYHPQPYPPQPYYPQPMHADPRPQADQAAVTAASSQANAKGRALQTVASIKPNHQVVLPAVQPAAPRGPLLPTPEKVFVGSGTVQGNASVFESMQIDVSTDVDIHISRTDAKLIITINKKILNDQRKSEPIQKTVNIEQMIKQTTLNSFANQANGENTKSSHGMQSQLTGGSSLAASAILAMKPRSGSNMVIQPMNLPKDVSIAGSQPLMEESFEFMLNNESNEMDMFEEADIMQEFNDLDDDLHSTPIDFQVSTSSEPNISDEPANDNAEVSDRTSKSDRAESLEPTASISFTNGESGEQPAEASASKEKLDLLFENPDAEQPSVEMLQLN